LRDTAFVATSKARTRPQQSDSRRARAVERTRTDILDAAARVFAGRGYHAATMQLIAREAGFTAASLYTYFPGKESIYGALVDAFAARIMAVFEEPEPGGLSFPQRLELLLQRQLQLVAAEADALRLMFDIGPPQAHHSHDASPRRFLARLSRFVGEAGRGVLRVPAAEAALLLHGIGHALVLGWLLDSKPLEPVQLAARTVDLFLHGVGAR
jgi:TetR/AcrR family fatty acid metabolism transcriptional regulator